MEDVKHQSIFGEKCLKAKYDTYSNEPFPKRYIIKFYYILGKCLRLLIKKEAAKFHLRILWTPLCYSLKVNLITKILRLSSETEIIFEGSVDDKLRIMFELCDENNEGRVDIEDFKV